MTDIGICAEIRKALRKYDNPENGHNLNYLNREYLNSILDKYKFANEDALRKFIVPTHKRSV